MRKILLITNHDPLATGYGAGQRTNHIWTALKALGKTDVAWLTESDNDSVKQYEIDGEFFTKIETRPEALADHWWNALASQKIQTAFQNSFDLSAYEIVVSRYILPAAKLGLEAGQCRTLVIDFDDPVYHFPYSAFKNLRSLAKESIRLINQWLIHWKVRHTELSKARYLFISSRDANAFPYLTGTLLPNIPYLPDTELNRPRHSTDGQNIVFIGMMTYQPNIEAVDYFLNGIWPEILKQCPDTRFRIIGKANQKERERWQRNPGCIVEGYVKDLAEVYASASLAISPILSGGGSNIKIPEACAYGCPVVATEYSYAGWSDHFERDKHLLVACNSDDFSTKCIYLLRSEEAALGLSRKSKDLITKKLMPSSFAKYLTDSLL